MKKISQEFLDLISAVKNSDIDLINNLYASLDMDSLVLLLEYIKVVTEELLGEKLSYLRELSFYTSGVHAHFYYVNKKREEYRYPVKINKQLLEEFEVFIGGMNL